MDESRGIPRKAIRGLIDHCEKAAKKSDESPAVLFKRYLELIKEYADYFFSEPWANEPNRSFLANNPFRLEEEAETFIGKSESYSEELERFTVFCLRRNTSLCGFNSEGFVSDFGFFGNLPCRNCVVSDVTWLRDHVKRLEEAMREVEEEMKSEKPSLVTLDMAKYYSRPDVIRNHKMCIVNLRFFEKFGDAEGKNCQVRNKYMCPYGEAAVELTERGRVTKVFWRVIEWYNDHWNRSMFSVPSESDMKWYHYDEPSLIDVADYDDILKAFDDGRFQKIVDEYVKYERERES